MDESETVGNLCTESNVVFEWFSVFHYGKQTTLHVDTFTASEPSPRAMTSTCRKCLRSLCVGCFTEKEQDYTLYGLYHRYEVSPLSASQRERARLEKQSELSLMGPLKSSTRVSEYHKI